MENVCPICNKLKDVVFQCKLCGGDMMDRGRIQDYADAYSNQQEINDAPTYCKHLFKCNCCDNMETIGIEKVKF